MTQREVNKLRMFKQVLDVTSANQAAWSAVPAFSTNFTKFKTAYDALTTITGQPSGNLTGIATLQREKRAAAAAKAAIVASALRSYAADMDDPVLAEKLAFSNSDLSIGSGIAVIERMDLVLSLAITHASNLTDYGISQSQLDELAPLIEELKGLQGSPRTAIIDRKERNGEIDALLKQMSDLLDDKLDQLANVLKSTQPAFYDKYKSARMIIDAKGKLKPGGLPDGPDPLPE